MDLPDKKNKVFESTTSVLDELETVLASFEQDGYFPPDIQDPKYSNFFNIGAQEDSRSRDLIPLNIGENVCQPYFVCNECSFKTNSRDILIMHRKVEHIRNLGGIVISQVKQTFNQKGTEEIRQVRISPEKKPSKSGKFQRNQRGRFLKKKRITTTADTKPCNLCSFLGTSKSDIRNHFKTSHKDKTIFNCSDCGYGSNYLCNMKNHKETQHERKTYQCDHCEYKSIWKTSFLEHKRAKHDVYQRMSKHYKVLKGPVKCDICNFSAISAKRLVIHKSKKHNLHNESVQCGQCDFKAISERGLKCHTWSMHKVYKVPKEYRCELCDITEYRIADIRKHRRAIHGKYRYKYDQEYPCDLCDYVAKQRSYLAEHKESVHEGIKHPCTLCSYVATFKRNLNTHTLTVHNSTQAKKFSCDLCDYVTKRKYYLTVHKDGKHEGVVYPCSKCDYKGTTKTYLHNHTKNVHSAKETHPCDMCGFLAKNKTYLNAHKKRAHGDKIFKCDKCNYQAVFKCVLETHQKKVHKESINQLRKADIKFPQEKVNGSIKTYDCSKCNYKSHKMGYLITHKQMVHEEKPQEISIEKKEEQERNFLKIVQQLRKECQN